MVSRLDQAVLGGVERSFGPVGGVGLVQNVAYVEGHGPHAYEQLFGYRPVCLPGRHEPQNLYFPLGVTCYFAGVYLEALGGY